LLKDDICMTLTLNPTTPYSFNLFTNILSRYPQPSLFQVCDGAYLRTLRLNDETALVRVTAPDNAMLHIEAITGDAEAASAKIAHTLALDADISDFYAFSREHEALWRIVEPLQGLPLDRSESVYEALMFVIIEQHISWVNAQKAQRQLVEWANNTIEHAGQKHYVMPSPAQIANATIDDLKPLKITFKRMELMIELSKKIVSGELDLEALLHESPETMYTELLKIKGIGHWTASVVVSRAMGVFPYVAHNDVALQAAVSEYFGVPKSAAALQTTFAQFGNYAGLAAHFTLMRWVLDKYPILR
jgi:DNA-3-methyladenine glycosylase II